MLIITIPDIIGLVLVGIMLLCLGFVWLSVSLDERKARRRSERESKEGTRP